MTTAERRVLAAALRHGRTRYAFRSTWYLGAHDYAWYSKPFTGRDDPLLTVTNWGDEEWLLEFGVDRAVVSTVERALKALAFFGVYQPAMAEVA